MDEKIRIFDFLLVRSKAVSRPTEPAVQMFVSRCRQSVDEPALISDLMLSEQEIDVFVQDLKDDLDEVGRCAKAALSKSRPAAA